MNKGHRLLNMFKAIGSALTVALSMSACATSTFTWKEEVLLHDGRKVIVERSDTYDSNMRHEIGQSAPLAEHQTTFVIPYTNQMVIWKSDNRSFSEPDGLHLLALDFINGMPYVATLIFGRSAYNKWGKPNPPYVFFKYDGTAWKRISIEEFPETLKNNVTLPLDELNKKEVTTENRQYGFVRAQTVAKINREPGRSKESYTIFRTPLDHWKPRPETDLVPTKDGLSSPDMLELRRKNEERRKAQRNTGDAKK
jgi:hypothetical protein